MKGVERSIRHFVAVIAVVSACDKSARPDAGVTPSSARGTLIGVVKTRAAKPAPLPLPESVHKVCGPQLEDATVQLGADGALANAVVIVDDAEPTPATSPPPLLDQQKCAYRPPVLVAHTGGKLKVKNSDPLMHNVRAGELFNVGMPIEHQVIERAMPATPGPVKIVCDVHPWMRADVMVLPHDSWAITDSSGRFTIRGVTAGTRAVRVWHPTLGEQRLSVDVPAGGEGKLATEL